MVNLAAVGSNATSKKSNDADTVSDPFRKSTRFVRSPIKATSLRDNTRSHSESTSFRTDAIKATVIAHGAKNSSDKHEKTKMLQLGLKIDGLIDFYRDKHNVHGEIKKMGTLIKSVFREAESEVADLRSEISDLREQIKILSRNAQRSQATTSTQTDIVPTETNAGRNVAGKEGQAIEKSTTAERPVKRNRDDDGTGNRPEEQPLKAPATKKTRLHSPKKASGSQSVDPSKKVLVLDQRKQMSKMTITKPKPNPKDKSTQAWVKVGKEKRATNVKKPPRPDAIVIKKTGDLSYADLLRKLKADPSLKEVGTNVSRIRKTAGGDLLLSLNQSANPTTAVYKDKIKEALGENGNVWSLTQEVLLECKDIDEATSKEEICAALTEQVNFEFKTAMIKNVRKAYGGTQTATISLPTVIANKLLEIRKVRIGWVYCRIREKIVLKRCFRCLEFGHFVKACKSPNDRTALCIRCGENGHKLKDCKGRPNCLLCKAKSVESGHITGSRRCPEYKNALETILKKI